MIKILKIAVFIIACGSLQAQDFHLSQYDAASVNLNPAMTGMFKGDLRVHAHYRNQWSAIATKPFTTMLIAGDMQVKKIAIGAQVANFRAGIGNFNHFSFLVSAAYDIKLSKNNNHHLSVGLQGGLFQKSVDFSKLTFGVQYSPYNGGGFDQAVANGETVSNNSVLKGDLNAGLMYYYGKEGVLINPFAGFAVFHVNQPTETFFSTDNKLPMRWIAHGGFKLNLTEKIQFLAKTFYMGEKNARELTYTLDLHYYLKDSDNYLLFGPTFRNKDAAVIMGGLKMGKFIYRLSYDINTSSLKNATNGRGGIEFSVTFINKKYDPNPIKTCPRL